MIGKKYLNENTNEISFPLGGIGTGSIGLAGNGALIDWEIQNKPNKGSTNGYSHFAVKAETDGKLIDARVMNGDLKPPYVGTGIRGAFGGFGFGPERGTMAGVPHFKTVEFTGAYPIAKVDFFEEKFPGDISLKAFNPLIPLNEDDSSIPSAFFEVEIVNTTDSDIDYTVALSLSSLLGGDVNTELISSDKLSSLMIKPIDIKTDDINYGDMTVATDSNEISYQQSWFRGSWFDELEIYWQDFTSAGKFKNRSYNEPRKKHYGSSVDTATLAVHVNVRKGETQKVKYVISWNFPNCFNYWNKSDCGDDCECGKSETQWKNYYTKLFNDSYQSALYSLNEWDRMYSQSMDYVNALFESSLPKEAIDAISANVSILKSPTCMRLENGEFYGWEGVSCDCGCCEGSCTHVWNYAYALAYLFPNLERSIRELDYKYNQLDNGGMAFRMMLPLGNSTFDFRACADGQFGGVMKVYREWKICGDKQWLKEIWPKVKKSIEYAWDETNEDKWDLDKTGVLWGRQHHTLDMELFRPNSWLTGFYLGALKAGAEMAKYLGDEDTYAEYINLFEKGKKWTEENLYNGEYYQQKIDVKDFSILKEFVNENDDKSVHGVDFIDSYWNDEAKQIKYQIDEGCAIDQVVAGWHANLIGLGEIFDSKNTKSALKSIYNNNYKESMREEFNPCRLYSLNDEAGAVICSYPEGKRRPVVPMPYTQETMHGFEYQVACHMIMEGLLEEGMDIVKSVRDKYDGFKRNPWNEIECGSNYARSMASYSLLLAYSGFRYDMSRNMIGFNPIHSKEDFTFMWSLNDCWGVIKRTENQIQINILGGVLNINQFQLPFIDSIKTISVDGKQADAMFNAGVIAFDKIEEISECLDIDLN